MMPDHGEPIAPSPESVPTIEETEILKSLVNELDSKQLQLAHDRLGRVAVAETGSMVVPPETLQRLKVAVRDLGLLKNVQQPESMLIDRAGRDYLSSDEIQQFGQVLEDEELSAMLTELTKEVERRRTIGRAA